ncbi:MAG: energy transducer TonB [Muribaculaceae bacterium]|jgi:protein TonB|nr:energy transducer TonB [Muribaculaceae bacterium]MBQ5722631.1 energy transducer TonB [Muribaculaceae bacterium]
MAKNVDLTSKEWRDLVFEGKNQEFGAYQLRKSSDKRHNLAMLYVLIGLAVVAAILFSLNMYNDYRAEIEAAEAKERAEKMSAAQLAQMEEVEEVEEEVEEQRFEQPEIEVPQEVLATVQVTQIAIVDAEEVKNEVMDMEAQQEDNTARGVVNQEGSDDADKFQAVAEQVVVKEPEPEPVKEEEIFVAVEQQPEFPGGTAALMKWLASNVRYPQMALENGISGRVIVKFVVEKDGSVSGVTLVRGVDKDLDREAIRVVKSMPKWQPGKNNGQAVRCYFNLPVNFKLAEQ